MNPSTNDQHVPCLVVTRDEILEAFGKPVATGHSQELRVVDSRIQQGDKLVDLVRTVFSSGRKHWMTYWVAQKHPLASQFNMGNFACSDRIALVPCFFKADPRGVQFGRWLVDTRPRW